MTTTGTTMTGTPFTAVKGTPKYPEVWFLRVCLGTDNRLTLKALPNQELSIAKLKGGSTIEPVRDDWPIAFDKAVVEHCPIGSIFCTENLIKKTSSYQVKDIMLVDVSDIDGSSTTVPIPDDVPRASRIMRETYLTFRKNNGVVEDATIAPDAEPVKNTYLRRLKTNTKYLPPSKEEGFIIPDMTWYHLLRNTLTNVNTLLTGPAGTGKTEIVTRIAKLLGRNLYIEDMSTMQDPISSLMGVHRLKGGNSVFEYANFVTAIRDPKALILLDELNRAPVMSNNILLPCMDFRRRLNIAIAGSEDVRTVDVHEDVVFIATANLGGEYTGTNSLDRALIDRFQLIEMDYLSVTDEADILVVKSGIELHRAKLVTTLASNIRESYAKGDLGNFVSTRHTQQVAEMIKDGFEVIDSIKAVFLPLFEGNQNEPGTDKYQVLNMLTTQ